MNSHIEFWFQDILYGTAMDGLLIRVSLGKVLRRLMEDGE